MVVDGSTLTSLDLTFPIDLSLNLHVRLRQMQDLLISHGEALWIRARTECETYGNGFSGLAMEASSSQPSDSTVVSSNPCGSQRSVTQIKQGFVTRVGRQKT